MQKKPSLSIFVRFDIGATIRISREIQCLQYAGCFVKFCLFKSKGDQQFCILRVLGLFCGFPESTQSGRRMLAITFKASYTSILSALINLNSYFCLGFY